ncbi:hypothetical protein HK102_001429 [Quaeritorhiza haematococci]|nr:hypothetical protein HK102_001429 [Quaeritorhiza haematococci]
MSIVGMLINTVPVRVRLNRNASIINLIQSLQKQNTESLAHSSTSLRDIQKWAGVSGGQKLFQTLFVYENVPPIDVAYNLSQELTMKLRESGGNATEYDVEILVFPAGNLSSQLEVSVSFDTSMLKVSFIEGMIRHFDFVLNEMVQHMSDCRNPLPSSSIRVGATVRELLQMSPEAQKEVNAFQNGPRVQVGFEFLYEPLESQARTNPSSIAVEFMGHTMTYSDLHARATFLATNLVTFGVGPGTYVPLVLSRSLEMIIGIFAVMKCGAAYVPVDANFPRERICQILGQVESKCPLILTTQKDMEKVPTDVFKWPVLSITSWTTIEIPSGELVKNQERHLTTILEGRRKTTDSAAVIFTSGTTGKPKGVILPHNGILNIVCTEPGNLGAAPGVRIMQFMHIGFDACMWEIMATLSHGATLVLRDDTSDTTRDVLKTIKTVDHLMITPTGLSQLDPREYSRNLKRVVVVGEPCPQTLVEKWAHRVQLFNGYGPTEICIISHCGKMRGGSVREAVTVGPPVPNSTCYILDRHMQPVPVGVPGEILVAGTISLGYLENADLTAQRFLPDPFSPEPRKMYKTGDFGRWTSRGEVEIMGRADDQVKVRGYRVELQEVAGVLAQHVRVTGATVLVKDNILFGFVTPKNVNGEDVLQMAGEMLPSYMVPSAIFAVEEFPMSTNGKVDKGALAALIKETDKVDTSADLTGSHKKLAEIWSAVLNVPLSRIGPHTSFFEAGGDSISAIQLVAKCRDQGWRINTSEVFKHPTLIRMVRFLDQEQKASAASSESSSISTTSSSSSTKAPAGRRRAFRKVRTRGEDLDDEDPPTIVPLTPIQKWYFEREIPNFNQSFLFRARESIDLDKFKSMVENLVAHHDMFRARFRRDVRTGNWTQMILSVQRAGGANVSERIARNVQELVQLIEETERSLDITQGPIYSAVLIRFGEGETREDRIFFAVNHLIVDLVSWRVIMADMATLYAGGTLPKKSWTFKQWSEKQAEYANTLDPSVWKPYLNDSSKSATATTRPSSSSSRPAFYEIDLDESYTELLTTSNLSYRTTTLELLLGGLRLAYDSVHGRETPLSLMMEGHGRECWSSEIDIARTVGWFTSIFPVTLRNESLNADSNSAAAIEKALMNTKAMIRDLPDKGFTYGLLRHLNTNPELADHPVKTCPESSISFNYLGHFKSSSSGVGDALGKTSDGPLFIPITPQGDVLQ